jgi:hypothetical protein
MRRRVPHLSRALLIALTFVLAPAGGAQAQSQELRVVVVPGLELADLEELATRGAVGLLVPGAGPRVTEISALTALERGEVRNSLRGGLPSGPVRISIETATSVPSSDGVVVLGLPEGDQENNRRYPIAVLADGYEGLLTSESTRIRGLVSIVDVAPTALGEPDRLRAAKSADPAGRLRELDDRIYDNDRTRAIGPLLAGVLILALATLLPRAAVLGFAAALATNLALGAAGVSTPWIVLLAIGLAIGIGSPLLALVARSPLAVAVVLVAAVVAYLVVLVTDGEAVALSPLGPTQNSRFFGLSNVLSALLLVPALTAAAILRAELGWLAAGSVAAISLVAVGGSRFGADGGTVIALLAAFAVLAVEIARSHRRLTAMAAGLAAAAVGTLLAIDAITGAASHLGDAIGGGPGGLAADLGDRIALSWERATIQWYHLLLVVVGAGVLALLVARLFALSVPPAQRALPLSIAVGTFVSLLVNDSPLYVISVGIVAYLATQAYAFGEAATPRARFSDGPYRRVAT